MIFNLEKDLKGGMSWWRPAKMKYRTPFIYLRNLDKRADSSGVDNK